MLDDKSVMAVIRAARPTFWNRHDKVAFAVHAAFLASGYVLTAVGSAASSSDALSSNSGISSQSTSTNEVAAEIRALRVLRDNEVETMSKLGKDRIELELKKEQRKAMKMNLVILSTLLAKNH